MNEWSRADAPRTVENTEAIHSALMHLPTRTTSRFLVQVMVEQTVHSGDPFHLWQATPALSSGIQITAHYELRFTVRMFINHASSYLVSPTKLVVFTPCSTRFSASPNQQNASAWLGACGLSVSVSQRFKAYQFIQQDPSAEADCGHAHTVKCLTILIDWRIQGHYITIWISDDTDGVRRLARSTLLC